MMVVKSIGWPYFCFIKIFVLSLTIGLAIGEVVGLAMSKIISIKINVTIGHSRLFV